MGEALQPPNIETALIAYLTPRLGVRCATRVPNPRPDLFIQLGRIGGVSPNLMQDEPIVLLQAWGADADDSDGPAADLALQTYGVLIAAPGAWLTSYCWLYSARVSGPVNNPDTQSATPRYQLTATLRTKMRSVVPTYNG